MTVGLASAHADALLNVIKGTTSGTTWNTTHAQAHSADPGAAGTTASENAAFNNTRFALTWGTVGAGGGGRQLAITGTPEITKTTTGSTTVSHLSLWTASSAGTFTGSVALATSRTLAQNDILRLTSLTYTLTPIAA